MNKSQGLDRTPVEFFKLDNDSTNTLKDLDFCEKCS